MAFLKGFWKITRIYLPELAWRPDWRQVVFQCDTSRTETSGAYLWRLPMLTSPFYGFFEGFLVNNMKSPFLIRGGKSFWQLFRKISKLYVPK
jgi:hypothetical protein